MSDLAGWSDFYVIVGSAAAVLIGLQFVVMTLIAERPTLRTAEASAAFGSPTVTHFSAVLFLAALFCAPWPTIGPVTAICGLMGLSGVAYGVVVARRMRKQAAYQPGFEDWLFYLVLPWAAYVILTLSSALIFVDAANALFGVGAAALMLLFVGIHNSWDSVTYHVLVQRVRSDTKTPARPDDEASQ